MRVRHVPPRQGRAQPPPRAGEGGPSLQGEISRDLSPNDLIADSTKNIPSTSFHTHSSPEDRPPARPCGGALIASSQTWAWTCRFAVQLRHRWASFAARIAWICRCSIGVAYNWSSAQRALDNRDQTLCVSFVEWHKSFCQRLPAAPLRQSHTFIMTPHLARCVA